MAKAIFGAIMALLSFFGLALASLSHDGGFTLFAWLLTAFGIIMVFAIIAQLTRPEVLKGENSGQHETGEY